MHLIVPIVFLMLIGATIGFAYLGNLPATVGFGLVSIAFIIGIVGYALMAMFHSFIMALSALVSFDDDSATGKDLDREE